MSLGIGSIVSLGGSTSGSGGGGSGSGSGIVTVNNQFGPAITINGVNGVTATVTAPNVITINAASLSGLINSTPQSGVLGVNGITVQQVGGNFVVDGSALSGINTPSSGIHSVNGELGPAIIINGIDGITATVTAPNTITIGINNISGVSISAVASYSAVFSNLVSGIFDHNFGTRETIVQVYDASSPPRVILPDKIISENLNQTSVIFNRPQNGYVVIHAPSGISAFSAQTSQSGVIGGTGIDVEQVGGNFVVSTSGSSVSKFSANFSSITSGLFTHGLNNIDVIVQVFDAPGGGAKVILPDNIIVENNNQVSLIFNRRQTGKVVII